MTTLEEFYTTVTNKPTYVDGTLRATISMDEWNMLSAAIASTLLTLTSLRSKNQNLKSELEGRVEQFEEVTYQLKLKVANYEKLWKKLEKIWKDDVEILAILAEQRLLYSLKGQPDENL